MSVYSSRTSFQNNGKLQDSMKLEIKQAIQRSFDFNIEEKIAGDIKQSMLTVEDTFTDKAKFLASKIDTLSTIATDIQSTLAKTGSIINNYSNAFMLESTYHHIMNKLSRLTIFPTQETGISTQCSQKLKQKLSQLQVTKSQIEADPIIEEDPQIYKVKSNKEYLEYLQNLSDNCLNSPANALPDMNSIPKANIHN